VKVDVAAAMCLFLMVFAEAGPAHTDDRGRKTALAFPWTESAGLMLARGT